MFFDGLSAQLGGANLTAESISTTVTLSLEKLDAGWTITASHIDVVGKVPGADAATFQKYAEAAEKGCPVSKVLNAKIYNECEAGVGGASGIRILTLPDLRWFDTRWRLCRIEMWVFLIRRPRAAAAMKSTCHRGGIGRRAWFRSMYRQRCGGSSPFDGTKSLFFPPLLGLIHFSLRPTCAGCIPAPVRGWDRFTFSILISCGSDRGFALANTARRLSPTKSPGGRRGST